jgi:hypothetical protein
MKRATLLLFVLAFVTGILAGREPMANPISRSEQLQDSLMIWDKLNIQCEPRVKELLQQHVRQNKKNNSTNGYRLQIYFGSGANAHAQATKIRTDFLSTHPDEKAYLIFKSPDFKVLVGNYRTKSEAMKMQKSLINQFPNAFIVPDEIAFPELVNIK